MTEDKRKAKKYIGNPGYEENMVIDSVHQTMLKRLKDSGVLISIVSKNDKTL